MQSKLRIFLIAIIPIEVWYWNVFCDHASTCGTLTASESSLPTYVYSCGNGPFIFTLCLQNIRIHWDWERQLLKCLFVILGIMHKDSKYLGLMLSVNFCQYEEKYLVFFSDVTEREKKALCWPSVYLNSEWILKLVFLGNLLNVLSRFSFMYAFSESLLDITFYFFFFYI